MAKRKRNSTDMSYRPPSPAKMLAMDMDQMCRTLLMQDPVVKQREQQIRTELQKGVTQAKKTTKATPKPKKKG